MKLKDKIIIITGASSGLGEALAYKVAEEGARIALVARSEERLRKVKQRIIKNKGQAKYFVCDIRNVDDIQKTVSEIFKKFGHVDILVNDAGIWTDDSVEKNKPQLRKDALETNTYGNIEFTYAVLPYFQKLNKGYIFNVISTSGVNDWDNTFCKAYAATKWAMTGFTKALRDSLKSTKIKVTSFFPGGMDTELFATSGRTDKDNKPLHNQPWMMKKEDVADIIVFALTRPDDVLMERIVVTKKV